MKIKYEDILRKYSSIECSPKNNNWMIYADSFDIIISYLYHELEDGTFSIIITGYKDYYGYKLEDGTFYDVINNKIYDDKFLKGCEITHYDTSKKIKIRR